jgi:hypothetical protein
MSAIQPIDVATPNRAMPVPVSAESGGAEPGQPFAEVMRSAVSPAQTAQRAQKSSYPSNASGTSRPQFNRSRMASETDSNRADASASNSSNQVVNVNASIQTGDREVENSDSSTSESSSSADLNGAASSLVDGQAQASIPSAAVGDQSSGVTPQQVRSVDTEAGSSPSAHGRKQTTSTKEASGNQDASAGATTASIAIASVPGIVTKASTVNLLGEQGAASSVADAIPSKLKSIGSPTAAINSSVSNRATAPGLTTPTPQTDGATGAAAMLPHGAQTGDEERGMTSDLTTTANTTAISPANQNGGSEGSGGCQPASVADGTPAHASTNSISSSSADATPSNAGSTNGIGNPGSIGNDAVGSAGNGAVTSVHGNTGSKSSDSTAAMPTPATAAKDLPAPHANPADSGVGLQNGSSVFSPGNHFAALGTFSSSTAGSTAPRATTADAFTALDSAASGERGVLLHAAPHQVAVGVADPSLGWVEVRAERVSGQIAAALTTNSAASHEALTSVLPTMATYLQEHHAGVQQVHVESSLTGGQAGTGSQGQTASQSDAQSSSNNTAATSSPGSAWNAAPIARATIPTSQGTNFFYEGHHFSIRA